MRKNLSDLNTYLDKVEDHQSDWLVEDYLSGTSLNSVEAIHEELVALIKAIEDRDAAATGFQQSFVNAPQPISAQPYIVHERFDPRDLPTFDGKETSYASFKQAFLYRTSNIGMHDSCKQQLLARPDVQENRLESQLVELKQLRVKGKTEAPVDWLELLR